MKKRVLPAFVMAALIGAGATSCSKSDTPANNSNQDIQKVETAVLNDFVSVLANPLYKDFADKTQQLQDAVTTLINTPNSDNQKAAQIAWKAVRVNWEQSEGFLFGPVADDDYDPHLDSWPTDHAQLDNILRTQPDITAEDLEEEDDFVRGFHPLEYLLWDEDPENYTEAEKNYMGALATYILNNVNGLQQSWLGDGFGSKLTTPGPDNADFKTKQAAIETIAQALIDICDEVGNGKLVDPFGDTKDAADSTQSESPYSHNSIIDFTNNIQGAYNSYTCSFNGQKGTSLSDLVQVNNKGLDNRIKSAFENAINSFDGFKSTFELSIYEDRPTVQNVIDQIQALSTLLNAELVPYIQQYVKD